MKISALFDAPTRADYPPDDKRTMRDEAFRRLPRAACPDVRFPPIADISDDVTESAYVIVPMRENLAKVAALALAVLMTMVALRGIALTGAVLALSALAAGSLYMAFGNALLLLVSKRALVQFYRGTEDETFEEYSKRPYGNFGNVVSPLTFGLFLLLCLHQ
jgi:hypothetical protein